MNKLSAPKPGSAGPLRLVFAIAGWLSLLLAAIGALLPLMPGTPFFMLALYFFARSSPRFHNWLLTNRWFGATVNHWSKGRGLKIHTKFLLLFFVWMGMAVTGIYVLTQLWLRIGLAACALGVAIYLFAFVKTLK